MKTTTAEAMSLPVPLVTTKFPVVITKKPKKRQYGFFLRRAKDLGEDGEQCTGCEHEFTNREMVTVYRPDPSLMLTPEMLCHACTVLILNRQNGYTHKERGAGPND